MKLVDLHEQFIEKAQRPMDLGAPAIVAQRPVPIIVPANRWVEKNGRLTKSFGFRRSEDRKRFIDELLEYEDQVQHHATLLVNEGEVLISLVTKGIDRVTERDKEYALYADSVFKDVVFSP